MFTAPAPTMASAHRRKTFILVTGFEPLATRECHGVGTELSDMGDVSGICAMIYVTLRQPAVPKQ